MPEPDERGLAARLRRLPGQLLLALVNATAILVIVAAVLALVAYSKVEQLAANVAATMTDAVLSRVDVEPQGALANLKDLAADIRELSAVMREARAEGDVFAGPQIERLDARLAALQANIARLTESRSQLVEEAFAGFGRALAEGLESLRSCGPAGADA